MNKKTLVICNPNGGNGISKDLLEKFKDKLNSYGYNAKLVLTKEPNHATKIVEKCDHFDIVFSIGGDGTLNEVVNGNSKRKDKLTICPMPTGSCNDVASMFGYKKDLLKNIDLAVNGTVKEINIPNINGKAFVCVAGMGKFLNIAYDTTKCQKNRFGYFAYILEGLKDFFKSPKMYDIEVEADGVRLDGKYSIVMISNSNRIAGVNGFQKDVLLDDEELEVILCKCKNNISIVYSFLDYFMHNKNHNLISFKAHDIKLKFDKSLDNNPCIDGEKLERNKLTYHISASDKMNFLVSKDVDKKLFIK